MFRCISICPNSINNVIVQIAKYTSPNQPDVKQFVQCNQNCVGTGVWLDVQTYALACVQIKSM